MQEMQDKSQQPAAAHERAAAAEFLNLHEIVAKARQNLHQNDWDYIVGGTETETTLRRNRLALDRIAFRPRVLRDVSKVDASVDQLGRRLRLPVVLAPGRRPGELSSGRGGSRWCAPPASSASPICSARCASPGSSGSPRPRPMPPACSSSMSAATRRSSTITSSRAIAQWLCRLLPDRRYRDLQPARARHRQAVHHRRAAPGLGPRIPGGARLAHGRAHQEPLQHPARAQRHRHRRGRQDRDRAWGRLDLRVQPWRPPARSWPRRHGGAARDRGRRRRAGRRSWSTARSAAAATSSRRSPAAPIWSASAACNATRWRRPVRPASCACWSSWRTRSGDASACSGSANSPSSTGPICTRRQSVTVPHVLSAFPLLEIEDYRY